MRAAITFLLATCSACIGSPQYPPDWPQPDLTAGGCPLISGTYVDVGAVASASERNGDLPSGRLSRNFFDYEDGEIAYTTITRGEDMSLFVESYAQENPQLTRQLTLGTDFSCSDGRLWLADQTRVRDEGVNLSLRARIGFTRTEDGNLVGETRQRATGRVLIIPVLVRETDHILWERYESHAERSE